VILDLLGTFSPRGIGLLCSYRRRDELQAFENNTNPVGTTVQNRWALRHPAAEVAAAHARLGVWCEQNGLKPEATAHFTQAVVLDPHRDSAWKHLGFVSDQFYGYVGYDANGLPVVVRGAEMNSMAKLAALDAPSPTGKLHQLELRTQMLLAEP